MKKKLLFLSLLCCVGQSFCAEQHNRAKIRRAMLDSDNVVVRVPVGLGQKSVQVLTSNPRKDRIIKILGPAFAREEVRTTDLFAMQQVMAAYSQQETEIAEQPPLRNPATVRQQRRSSRYLKVRTDGVEVLVPQKKELFSRMVALLARLSAQDLPKGARVISYKFDERASQEGSLVFEPTVRAANGKRTSGGRIALRMVAEKVEDTE